jgi:hypothetical protein
MRSTLCAPIRLLWAASLVLLPATRVAAVCSSVVCPANVTVSNELNQCGAILAYPAPVPIVIGGAPTCGTIICAPASGAFYPVGSTDVTCTSSAGPGCAFTVTVTDTQPPQITAPADQIRVGTTPGMPLPVDYTFPTSSDNCPGVVANCNPPSGSAFPSGATPVACSATDAAGNTADTTFEVSYFDACVQDDTGGEFLRWRTADGVYELVDCDASACGATGFQQTGIGEATPTASGFQLRHKLDDRSLRASLQTSKGKGSARVKLRTGNTQLSAKLKDASFADDVCSCP